MKYKESIPMTKAMVATVIGRDMGLGAKNATIFWRHAQRNERWRQEDATKKLGTKKPAVKRTRSKVA
jgi:hypothetical protein